MRVPPGNVLLPTGDRVALGEFVVSFGRQHDCTVVLADPNVSRRHAEIRPAGDGYVVADLGSTNGTKVNGTRVAEHHLVDGDEVRFGNTVVHFEAPSPSPLGSIPVPEQLLTVLKLCLLALLYLFFLRVLRAVWTEVNPPKPASAGDGGAIAAPAPARPRPSSGRDANR